MKHLLSICCLLLVAGLTISVVSPQFHSFFCKSNNSCPHADGVSPCHSDGEEDEDEESRGSCPVVLFGKSSQAAVSPVFLLQPDLSLVQVFLEERKSVWFGRNVLPIWARGPPLRV